MDNLENKEIRLPYSKEVFEIGGAYEFSDDKVLWQKGILTGYNPTQSEPFEATVRDRFRYYFSNIRMPQTNPPINKRHKEENVNPEPNINVIDFPMIGRKLIFAYKCSDYEFLKFIKNYFGYTEYEESVLSYFENKDLPFAYAWCFYILQPCVGIIFIRDTDKCEPIPSLAHEALHFTFKVAKHMGIKHGRKSEEFYTYFLEHVIRECQKFITCK